MTRIIMTPELARAAATDAGNRSMRERGATRWNLDDYRRAARQFNLLVPNAFVLPKKEDSDAKD